MPGHFWFTEQIVEVAGYLAQIAGPAACRHVAIRPDQNDCL